MKKIQVAVIGVGYLGRFHAQKYAMLPEVDLTAVVDIDAQQARRVAGECGCKAYSDYKNILSGIDAVSIAVPTQYHHRVAADFLDYGVDVLLEKPISPSVAEAEDLIGRAEKKDCVFQIGHLERFNPAYLATVPYLNSPIFIDSKRTAGFNPRGTDVDVVLDLMIHDLDIILHSVQSPVAEIQATGGRIATKTNDMVSARLVFENGATAEVTASRVSRSNSREMRIFQDRTFLHLDFGNKKLTRVQLLAEREENGMPRQTVSKESFSESDALLLEIQSFLEAVRMRKQPVVSGKEACSALDVALKILKQVEEQQKKPVFTTLQNEPV